VSTTPARHSGGGACVQTTAQRLAIPTEVFRVFSQADAGIIPHITP
jgi:hypothetical protein